MPTGAAKLAIYQIAGVLLQGSTLVVSPLLALKRAQVESLDEVPPSCQAMVESLDTSVGRVIASWKRRGSRSARW